MKTTHKSIMEIIVQNDLCIGCGVCAGVCPFGYLEMKWNEFGELKPQQSDCNKSCNLCLEVCPFSNNEFGIDNITKERFEGEFGTVYRPETGFFQKLLVGHVLDDVFRMRSSSGGMTTWLLSTLLNSGIVDKAICVTGQDANPDRLFSFKIIENSNELKFAQGSRYYPVELSEVIAKILAEENDEKYAIVGLPCQLLGISLAMQKMSKLRKKIPIRIGLVCGQLPNKFYTELLTIKSGIDPKNTRTVNYRGKEISRPSNNFTFQAFGQSGEIGKKIEWNGIPFQLWSQGFFIHNACNYCDDVFAETADVTFMDAWNRKYIKDTKGNSYILIRSNIIKDVLEKSSQKDIVLNEVNVTELINSQLGVVKKKKFTIKGKIWFTNFTNKYLPSLRQKSDFQVFLKECIQIIIKTKIQILSKIRWQKNNNPSLFIDSFKFYVNISNLSNKVKRQFNRLKTKMGESNL